MCGAAKSWAEDGGDAGYTDAMELLDLGLHLIGDESEEVNPFFYSFPPSFPPPPLPLSHSHNYQTKAIKPMSMDVY